MKKDEQSGSGSTTLPDEVRRKLLRAAAVMGGAFVAGKLPYEKPALKSFTGTRAAWAQGTGPFTLTCSATASPSQGPGTVCQDGVISGIVIQVSPIPPVGTVLRCTPTTDDANNEDLPMFSSTIKGTDGAGKVVFADFKLIGNVPNPPLAAGSVLTMTVSFNNAAVGTATCVNRFTVVVCN